MRLNLTDVLFAFSYALDCVEYELLGATTNHGKRVAYISTILGQSLGFRSEDLLDLAACAVLHDNALTEYVKTEYNRERFERTEGSEIAIHCRLGENNVKDLPFQGDVKDVILYHHENVDGTGPFGKTAAETPLMAQLIHFADILDVSCNLGRYRKGKEMKVKAFLLAGRDTIFSAAHIDLFLLNFDSDHLAQLQGTQVDSLLKAVLPQRIEAYTHDTLFHIADMFATIIDYKSERTSAHSIGMANKAFTMAQYYGYDSETAEKLYLAGAVHDVGKLVVSNDILDKPDKLNAEEYKQIQTHAFYTHLILSRIEGFEDITRWASLHHEKLNGKGYPFGKTAEELDQKDRLMACLDVYQALTEERSYKTSMSHDHAMNILHEMVLDGSLDGQIVDDIDHVFGPQ